MMMMMMVMIGADQDGGRPSLDARLPVLFQSHQGRERIPGKSDGDNEDGDDGDGDNEDGVGYGDSEHGDDFDYQAAESMASISVMERSLFSERYCFVQVKYLNHYHCDYSFYQYHHHLSNSLKRIKVIFIR